MRLKHLTLTGYKTFASKSHFEFSDGVTAVIGPNGSGKSNVADSIRWALGEQQFSLLRGKKTDDMIFSGSAKRPRASMAEVILTFDNSDGFFPIEFNEIAIGRRAYRDGTNEYLLNGNRVRLRDITDLLGHTGLAERTYTVIGQGLVDSALSQRPEERRALFEEAAGIATYRNRRDDALSKLDETRRNLDRVRDILTEITPRLQQLERQTERARKYQILAVELDGHTRTWFSYHYRASRDAVTQSAQRRDQARARVDEAQQAVNVLDNEIAALRARQAELRACVAEQEGRRSGARQTADAQARDLAVLRERARSMESQSSDAQRELSQRTAALDDLATRAAHAAATLVGAQDLLAQRQRELETAQASAAESQAARAELERARNAAQQEVMRANAALTNAQNRLNSAQQRQRSLATQLAEFTRRVTLVDNQRDEAETRLTGLDHTMAEDVQRIQTLQARCDGAARDLESARAALTSAQSALAAAEAEEKMASRVSLFAEMRAQQGGSDLVALAQSANLPGFRGTLLSLIHAVPDDQKAVEAALGEAMKAVVVDSADGVTKVRAWLVGHTPQSGRLGVVPLPTLRPISEERNRLDHVLAERARAASARPLLDSIQYPAWLRPVLQAVGGRAFIARDLDAARELAAQLPGDCVCVTRDGEVVSGSGVLSLPAGPRSPIILGQEAKDATPGADEPPLISPEEARANRLRAAQARDLAQREMEARRRALDEANRSRDAFAREASTRRSGRDDTARRLNTLEEQLALMAGDIAQVDQQQADLAPELEQFSQSLARDQVAQDEARRALASIEQQLREQLASGWMEPLNAAHAAVATASEAARSAETMRRERLAALDEGVRQRDSRATRLAQLGEQHRAAQAALTTAQQASAEAGERLREIEAALAPVQAELNSVEASILEVDKRRREAELGLREADASLNALTLELARHNDELDTLRERAADALQTDEGDAGPDAGASAGQFSFESRERALAVLESLEPVDQLPDGIDERITQLRNQIRRLGAINFEAQREFDEMKQRHAFLTEQVADLEQATTALQQVIAELNDVMQATFRQTFDAIAAAFQSTFKVLFGGGQAKLSLINAENLDESGVEIHAQPPGKRPQTLALLSGGERSLTATALLFAILRVKPTPFCVLDEVDAALDEANVGRFRGMLENLADQSQFIVITHNRRTVEAASTIYGISMGVDGASVALSLRLEDVKE